MATYDDLESSEAESASEDEHANIALMDNIAVEMLILSHWIDLTRTDQIKISTALYCFQRKWEKSE